MPESMPSARNGEPSTPPKTVPGTREGSSRLRRASAGRPVRALGVGAGLLSLALLTAVACGPQENGEDLQQDTTELERPSGVEEGRIGNPPGEPSRPGTTQAARGTTRAAGGATTGEPIRVALTEFDIRMPETVPAGETVFEVTNDGAVEHNFEVEGQGTERELEQNLQPGQSDTLRVDLEPGTYQVYCPVEDHEERGMTMELRVTRDEA